jgi:uncharacterized protein YggE
MENSKTKLFQALTIASLVGAVLLGAMIITQVKEYRYIGGGVPSSNTISVSGSGEVFAAPDIANISFTVRESATKVSAAQDKVSVKVKAALAGIRKAGVADKDIKTQNYSSNPTYEWQEGTPYCAGVNCPTYRPGKQVITGYEVSQTVNIKVRNLEDVNGLVDGLATAGVTEMQGPNFAIDQEDALQAEARKQAIDKAKIKAELLAKQLGVSLVRIVSFSEGNNYPVYARAMVSGAGMDSAKAVPAPELPQGENQITSNVTITYEIR